MAKIYLSATYPDLKPHRDAVYRILRMLRHDTISMEDYVATDAYPLHKCLSDVASCDLYAGLLGWRYGYIPDRDNPERKSITELEYRQAGDLGLSQLMFLTDAAAPWSNSRCPWSFYPSMSIIGLTGRATRGGYLPLVVRSRERLRQPDLQLGWQNNWDEFCGNSRKNLPEPLWWMNENAWRKLRGKVEKGNCIALDYVQDATTCDSDNPLFSLVSVGAPVALWSRREEGLCDLKDQMEDFLRDKPVGELPQILRKFRRELWENEREDNSCYHLTLLWDDPGRRLPPPEDDDDYYPWPAYG